MAATYRPGDWADPANQPPVEPADEDEVDETDDSQEDDE
jgi:hypothetical protein